LAYRRKAGCRAGANRLADGGSIQPYCPIQMPDKSLNTPTLTDPAAEASVHPRRVMGFGDLVLFYVVTGVSLRWVATAATAGPSALVIWLMAWAAFFVPLAFAVVELSSRYPEEGGFYVWSKHCFGGLAGFLTGWSYWSSNLPFYPSLLYFTAASALFLDGGRWQGLAHNKAFFISFAIAGMAVPTLLNVLGLNVGKWLHNAGALGNWIPLGIVAVMGLMAWRRFGAANTFSRATLTPSTHLHDIIFWSTIAFAFGGVESASTMGEEIRDARRLVPPAVLVGGLIITLSYLLGTLGVLLALPHAEVTGLQGIMEAVLRIAGRLGMPQAVTVVALLITVGNLGAVGAWLAATARLPFVAGLDHYLPSAFGRLHPRWGTPYVALWLQFACGVVFIFLSQAGTSIRGAYNVLVSMSIIAYFIPYLFIFGALIRVQREAPGPSVARIPGGKPVAILLGCLGLCTTSITIFLSLLPAPDDPHKTLAVIKVIGLSALTIGIGAGLYLAGARRAARVKRAESVE
jgi:amino acid transporter